MDIPTEFFKWIMKLVDDLKFGRISRLEYEGKLEGFVEGTYDILVKEEKKDDDLPFKEFGK